MCRPAQRYCIENCKNKRGVAGNAAGPRDLVMATVTQSGPRLGIAPTCAALGLPRATYYRRRPARAAPPRRPSPRALGGAERAAVLAQLHTPRFVDLAPGEIYATLLDEGRYLCSRGGGDAEDHVRPGGRRRRERDICRTLRGPRSSDSVVTGPSAVHWFRLTAMSGGVARPASGSDDVRERRGGHPRLPGRITDLEQVA